jgi:hypothetical protein
MQKVEKYRCKTCRKEQEAPKPTLRKQAKREPTNNQSATRDDFLITHQISVVSSKIET